MRVFLALHIPDDVRRRIADVVAELSPMASGARWVKSESMHITLKFIGEAAPETIKALENAFATVHSPEPFSVRFRGAGAFPNPRRPRVLWVGLEATPNLADTASGIERLLEPLGIPREERPFQPHLTLARFPVLARQPRLESAIEALATREFGCMRTGEFHLFQSHLKRGGAEYTRLSSFHFCCD